MYAYYDTEYLGKNNASRTVIFWMLQECNLNARAKCCIFFNNIWVVTLKYKMSLFFYRCGPRSLLNPTNPSLFPRILSRSSSGRTAYSTDYRLLPDDSRAVWQFPFLSGRGQGRNQTDGYGFSRSLVSWSSGSRLHVCQGLLALQWREVFECVHCLWGSCLEARTAQERSRYVPAFILGLKYAVGVGDWLGGVAKLYVF